MSIVRTLTEENQTYVEKYSKSSQPWHQPNMNNASSYQHHPLLNQFVLICVFSAPFCKVYPPECIHPQPSSVPLSPGDKVKCLLWVNKVAFGQLKSLPYTAVKSWRWSKKVAQSWSLGVAKEGGVSQWLSDWWPVEKFRDITAIDLLFVMLFE